jgi:hypothetical protein
MKKILTNLFLLLMVGGAGQGHQPFIPDSWSRWQFLLGTWNAAGKGSPGEGAGSFSFAFDLQKRILVRKSHTDYPASGGRPAFAHDDLMIIYAEGPQFKADYYDNEGHIIHYAIEFSNDGRTCTLVSDATASQPRFRLTYSQLKEGQVGIKFELAPQNDPDKFKVYVEGSATRTEKISRSPSPRPSTTVKTTTE